MARYAETLKNRVVAKLLPPESACVSAIAKEVGVWFPRFFVFQEAGFMLG